MLVFTYVANDRQTTRKFPNNDLTTYSYDKAGLTATILYADGTRVTMAYDAVGNRTALEDSTGTTTFAYDAVNRIIGRTDPGALVQSYQYDSASRRTTLTDPDGGAWETWCDANGRVATSTDPDGTSITFAYDKANRLTTMMRSSGTVRAQKFDAASQVVSIIDTTSAAALIQRFTYAYDKNGNRTKIEDSEGPSVVTYVYDAKQRLTRDWRTGSNPYEYPYLYDAVDNTLFNGEQSITFAYDAAGRLVTGLCDYGTINFAYDNNGNLTSIQEPVESGTDLTTMSYDGENRMILHRHKDPLAFEVRTTMTYDGDDLKRSSKQGSALTTFVWDGLDIIQERS